MAAVAPPTVVPRRIRNKRPAQAVAALATPRAKRRRIVGKRNLQTALLVDTPLTGEMDTDAQCVYLVTFPHPKDVGGALVAPGTFDRGKIVDAILTCCREPEHDPMWLRRHPTFVVAPVLVAKMAAFREYHAANANGVCHLHYHVALLLVKKHRFSPIKRALLNKLKLASHWSCTHTDYSSPIRYGTRATPHKPRSALDPAPLLWPAGHPPLEVAENEPVTARALAALRRSSVQAAGEKGKPEPRVEEIDLWPIIVRSGIRNSPEEPFAVEKLLQYAKANASHKIVAWLFRNEEKVPKLIDKVWRWEKVDEFLGDATKSTYQVFQDALQSGCVCGGRWLSAVKESLRLNTVSAPDLCKAVLASLQAGRCEGVPVVTLAGRFGGEGKSLFLAPLRRMFGEDHVQERPAGGQFSLLGVETKKVALLDEWLFQEEDLPLPMQLLWLEGKPVPICAPQNQYVGHKLYRGTAPIFITTPEEALVGLSTASATKPQGVAGMLLRRLRVFLFSVPISKPPPPAIVPCPRCFTTFLSQEAARQ